MNKKKIGMIALATILVITVPTLIFLSKGTSNKTQPATVNQANSEQTVKDFTITAKNVKWEIKPGLTIDAMAYDGTVPGTTIRVTEGDHVRVKLINQLNEPTTIHWHGITLDNPNDGIPGVTQNAVKPNESFTYEFIAKTPGTYMYHSHQNSVNQIDKGLSGILIVDPKQPAVKYDRDYALMLDEWITGDNNMAGMNMGGQSNSGLGMAGMNMSGQSNGGNSMPGMNMGGQSNGGNNAPTMNMEEQMMAMYNTFTINGKSDTAIKPLEVKKGERVKVRLINIGNQTHKMHLHGASFKVTDTDGQTINEPQELKDVLVAVGAGERYDLEFVATGDPILLESHDDRPAAPQMKVTFTSESDMTTQKDTAKDMKMNEANLPVLNIAEYGKPKTALFGADTKFDKNFTMDLGANIATDGQVTYSINGKSFPNTDPYLVKEGDKVKIHIVNKSGNFIHPMHLHGHFFQVLSKNGKPVTGSPIIKDTINVLPNEEYEIAFVADNPGDWMFHCHDLHHAEAGMVTAVKYEGYKPNFTVDPTAGNKPE